MTGRSPYASRFTNRAEALHRYGAMADLYGRLQLVGDPVADAVAREVLAEGARGRARFETALSEGIGAVPDASDALRRFFAEVDAVPEWVDPKKLRLGARTYQRTGQSMMLVLSAWSLMNGYHSSAAVKPLMYTRQLDAQAPRRLAETGRFLVETCQDGGLERFAPGLMSAVRVRMMHALVRQMILRGGEWRTEDWGVPINQGDMAGTILEFSLLLLEGCRVMGFHFEPNEADAVVHLWRYVGYLSGVDQRLLEELSTEARGVRFAEMVKLVQPRPDQDSIDLAAALRVVPRKLATNRLERLLAPFTIRYHDGLTRVFNGDAAADALRIPNPHWKHMIVPTRLFIAFMERMRRTLPGGTRAVSWLGNRFVRQAIDRMLAGQEPDFEPSRAA
jgi:hypothetical protein